MLRTPKSLIPLAVAAFWLVMMGLLLHREVVGPMLHPRPDVSRLSRPQDVWMGLYFGGDQRAGFVHWSTEPANRGDDAGYTLEVLARLTMPLFGQNAAMSLSGTAWQSAANGLREFDFTLRSGDYDMRIEGGVRRGALEARVHTAGEVMPLNLPVDRELLLGGGMGLSSMALPALEPGQTAQVDTFDPTTMSVGRAKVEAVKRERLSLGGAETDTTLITTTIGGITTRAWIDANQEVVRAETPFGITVQRITPEEALAPVAPGEQANLLQNVSIAPAGKTPARDETRMRVRFTGIPEDRMPPETQFQRRDGDAYEITTPVPDPAAPADDITAAEVRQYLGSDAFISAGHERIKALAAEIAGGAEDNTEKARLLLDWVYGNIEKKHTLSMPSALDVLRTREGDCNEHSVLFTALARAAGIPARTAIGLAWSGEINAFGYHAWAELYLGRWTPMDPTFGQQFADATHIKLVDGGPETWPRLLGYIGNLDIEVLETGPKPQEPQ